MGAGLAKEFKKKYPEMYKDYRKTCEKNKLKIGNLHLFKTLDRLIINFPTKKHWRNNSRIEWIEKGLEYFVSNYKKWNITSVAFPQLGTNHGKLDWEEVQVLMESFLNLDDLHVEIYVSKRQNKK
jgi:O-acetyl-ADP-ribose deacetylase (regulator of RNase III)